MKVAESVFKSRQEAYKNSERSFAYIENIDHNNPARKVKTLPGSGKIHSAPSTDQALEIEFRGLSCYYQPCKDGVGVCENSRYVSDWEKKLRLAEQCSDDGENTPADLQGDVQCPLMMALRLNILIWTLPKPMRST